MRRDMTVDAMMERIEKTADDQARHRCDEADQPQHQLHSRPWKSSPAKMTEPMEPVPWMRPRIQPMTHSGKSTGDVMGSEHGYIAYNGQYMQVGTFGTGQSRR